MLEFYITVACEVLLFLAMIWQGEQSLRNVAEGDELTEKLN